MPELLGFHGLVVRTGHPVRTAALWSRATGLPIRRRGRDQMLLGDGPELFVLVRRARRGEAERIEELHLAVKDVKALGRKTLGADHLGGDGFFQDAGSVRLRVREFRRPPAASWTARRKRARAARG